jgi:hypothetical protein
MRTTVAERLFALVDGPIFEVRDRESGCYPPLSRVAQCRSRAPLDCQEAEEFTNWG